jgi:hypothetical protein
MVPGKGELIINSQKIPIAEYEHKILMGVEG